MPIEHLLYT